MAPAPRIPGDPGSCRAAADGLRRLAAAHRGARREVQSTGRAVVHWTGRAAAAASARRAALCDALGRDAVRIERLATALGAFADDLEEAQDLAAMAAAATLAPGSGPCAPDPAALSALARARERDAHDRLLAAIAAAFDDGIVEELGEGLGFLPPDRPDRTELAAWGQGLAFLGADTAAALHLERLAPLDPRYGRHTDLVARAEQLARRVESRAHTVGRVTGPVGAAATLGTAFRAQWKSDADDPTLSQADRLGRAGVRAGAEGGAALAGGLYGGQLGASIGTMVMPGVGTVVGGVAGGMIGSFAASRAGGAVADHAVGLVDDVVDVAADAASVVASAGAEVGGAIGEALDDLCLWD